MRLRNKPFKLMNYDFYASYNYSTDCLVPSAHGRKGEPERRNAFRRVVAWGD